MAQPKATGAGRSTRQGGKPRSKQPAAKPTAEQRAAAISGRSRRKLPPNELRCTAKTKANKRCPNVRAAEDDGELLEVCLAHAPAEFKRKRNFGGMPGRGGRPRTPRPTELIRERLERKLDDLLDEIERIALEGTKTVVVPGTREVPGFTEQVDDLELRRRAIENILDRLAGKPTATHLVGGAGEEEPVKVDVPNTTERAAEVAAILKEAGAL